MDDLYFFQKSVMIILLKINFIVGGVLLISPLIRAWNGESIWTET